MDTKKYIIEIPDNTAWLQWVKVSDKDGHVCFDFKDPEDLTPYTEPDTEQVREEAFKNGYDAACKDIDVKSKINAAYRKGLEVAWDAARKIVHLQWDGAWAGVDEVEKWFDTYTASEAIEKIRQHEQEQGKIKVWDEVSRNGDKGIITKIGDDGYHFNVMWENGSTGYYMIKDFKKTGRHYPEIAEVLRKMQEEES